MEAMKDEREREKVRKTMKEGIKKKNDDVWKERRWEE